MYRDFISYIRFSLIYFPFDQNTFRLIKKKRFPLIFIRFVFKKTVRKIVLIFFNLNKSSLAFTVDHLQSGP